MRPNWPPRGSFASVADQVWNLHPTSVRGRRGGGRVPLRVRRRRTSCPRRRDAGAAAAAETNDSPPFASFIFTTRRKESAQADLDSNSSSSSSSDPNLGPAREPCAESARAAPNEEQPFSEIAQRQAGSSAGQPDEIGIKSGAGGTSQCCPPLNPGGSRRAPAAPASLSPAHLQPEVAGGTGAAYEFRARHRLIDSGRPAGRAKSGPSGAAPGQTGGGPEGTDSGGGGGGGGKKGADRLESCN